MDDTRPGPQSAFEALGEALARQRAQWQREAQEALAAALKERGRDPALAPLIAGSAKSEPPSRR